MAIIFNEKERVFTLTTSNSAYQLAVGKFGHLLHTYYGADIGGQDMRGWHKQVDRGFSPVPAEAGTEGSYSLDTLPLEFPTAGVGDFRIKALEIISEDGAAVTDLRYAGHAIKKGKNFLDKLPHFFDEKSEESETLEIYLEDKVSKIRVTLFYSVFEEKNFIVRSAYIQNLGETPVQVTKAASLAVDFPFGDFDLLHFYGRHAMERELQRMPLMHGIQSVASERGASSNCHNPGFILAEKDTNEFYGDCFGFNLVYSGNFAANIELDQCGQTRVTTGLSGNVFTLAPTEGLQTPEGIMVFSSNGFTELSNIFHAAVRHNLQKGKHVFAKRPVVINNWEATYFNFTGEKLLDIARHAADIDADMLVLDDGWFGERDDDRRALGDWFVNEKKLGMTLKQLAEGVNKYGLKFGIWFEPEMVSENSRLFEAHPDWALLWPNRQPTRSRNQLVLDFSRKEVVDYMFGTICAILDSANIEYVKWDMNRNISDNYSSTLSAEKQRELPHRYILGVYDLLERLTSKYPNVLFEGCSGGGGRFDLGMLHYHPQIWCSDNTDPISRTKIQYGTSFFYPLSSISAHVSVAPNHQTGRITPWETRGLVATTGAFGFELDVTKMNAEEKEKAKSLTAFFNKHQALISNGQYFRLESPYNAKTCAYVAWQFASRDKSQALLCAVALDVGGNSPSVRIKLRGLDENAVYVCNGEKFTGKALMNAGFTHRGAYGNYPSASFFFEKTTS